MNTNEYPEFYEYDAWRIFIDSIINNKIPGYNISAFGGGGRYFNYSNYNSVYSLSKRINVSNEIKLEFIKYFQNALNFCKVDNIYNISSDRKSLHKLFRFIDIGDDLENKIAFLIFLSNGFYLKNTLSNLIKSSSDFSYNPLTKEYKIAGFPISGLLKYNLFTEDEKEKIIAILNQDKDNKYFAK